MMHQLKHLRDFMDEETKKWLPGNLRVENCILLTQHRKDEDEFLRTFLLVFDRNGTFIGEIKEPEFIPKRD